MNERPSFATDLHKIRTRLGLTHHAMAELLYTSQQTYRNWEGDGRPRADAAARIERFLTSANDQLHWLEENGADVADYTPLNLAASALGIPHETLFHAYRSGGFEAKDLGVLGIWVRKDDLDLILESAL